jgi:hypothetical protein
VIDEHAYAIVAERYLESRGISEPSQFSITMPAASPR